MKIPSLIMATLIVVPGLVCAQQESSEVRSAEGKVDLKDYSPVKPLPGNRYESGYIKAVVVDVPHPSSNESGSASNEGGDGGSRSLVTE